MNTDLDVRVMRSTTPVCDAEFDLSVMLQTYDALHATCLCSDAVFPVINTGLDVRMMTPVCDAGFDFNTQGS